MWARFLLLPVLALAIAGCSPESSGAGAAAWPQLLEVEAAARAADEAGADKSEAVTSVVVAVEQLRAAGVPDGVDDPEGCAALLEELHSLSLAARDRLGDPGQSGGSLDDHAKAFHPLVLRLMEVSGSAKGWCPTCGEHHDHGGHEHGGEGS